MEIFVATIVNINCKCDSSTWAEKTVGYLMPLKFNIYVYKEIL